MVSRFHMSEQQEEDKKNYEAKERQAALRKSKEMKLADMKVSNHFLWYLIIPIYGIYLAIFRYEMALAIC